MMSGPSVRCAGILAGLGILSWAAPVGAQNAPAGGADARSYLEQLGARWTAALPPDRTLGIYFGRKWIGQASASVKLSSAEDATFEVSWNAESKLSGKWWCTRERVLLGRKLELVSAQSFEEGPFGKISSTVTVHDGRWKLRKEQKGTATYQEGGVKAGTTWNASFLPLYGRPEATSLTLYALDGDQSPVTLGRSTPLPQPRQGDDENPDCRFEVRRGNGAPGVWRYSRDGAVVEFRPVGEFVRLRPVAASEVGKDLQDPREMSEPVKALAELFRAVKRGDRPAVAAAFDFDSLAQELVPGYAGLDAAQQRQLVESLRSKTPADLISAKFRDALPEEALLEDYFAAASIATEKEGRAEIRLPDNPLVWKLSRAAEGRMKGHWVVTGIK